MKLGLTGGIGCGKSTAAGIFRELGWRVIETDAVVGEVLASNRDVIGAIRERWGGEAVAADGSVDRKAVAGKVFADEAELKWLESLLHPPVRLVWTAAVEAEPQKDWVVEIPLLFEKSLERAFDLTVCLECPLQIVRERMIARGYSEKDIEERRARQLPLEEKIRRADHVISNPGSIEYLKRQIVELNKLLNRDA